MISHLGFADLHGHDYWRMCWTSTYRWLISWKGNYMPVACIKFSTVGFETKITSTERNYLALVQNCPSESALILVKQKNFISTSFFILSSKWKDSTPVVPELIVFNFRCANTLLQCNSLLHVYTCWYSGSEKMHVGIMTAENCVIISKNPLQKLLVFFRYEES